MERIECSKYEKSLAPYLRDLWREDRYVIKSIEIDSKQVICSIDGDNIVDHPGEVFSFAGIEAMLWFERMANLFLHWDLGDDDFTCDWSMSRSHWDYRRLCTTKYGLRLVLDIVGKSTVDRGAKCGVIYRARFDVDHGAFAAGTSWFCPLSKELLLKPDQRCPIFQSGRQQQD